MKEESLINDNDNNNYNDEKIKKENYTFSDLHEQVLKFEEVTGKDFSKFFNTYYPKLIYYISKICKDDDMAQDIAIESFINSLEKIDNYVKDKAQYSTWLFTIARNGTLQAIKDNNKFVSIDNKIDDDSSTIKNFLANKVDDDLVEGGMHIITQEKARITIEGIKKLKQPYRRVVEMRELERMSYKEIATELGSDIHFEIDVIKRESIKMPNELSYATDIIDLLTGESINNFRLIEGDSKKTPFYTHIELPFGRYKISGREPNNLSTLKSQIRNGRILLEKIVKKDFKKIIKVYGD